MSFFYTHPVTMMRFNTSHRKNARKYLGNININIILKSETFEGINKYNFQLSVYKVNYVGAEYFLDKNAFKFIRIQPNVL